MTNRSAAVSDNGLPSGFDTQRYGTPPHLRVKGPASVTSDAGSNSSFAKIKAAPRKIVMDEARREREREKNQEEDDITVEASDSDSD